MGEVSWARPRILERHGQRHHRNRRQRGVPVGVLLFKARLVRRPAYRSSGSRPGVCKVLLLI